MILRLLAKTLKFSIIATFDVYSVTVNGSVVNGRVCLTVEYVEGHEPSPHCYVVFRSRCVAS